MSKNISLEEKIDLLFKCIENTADYWDDDAARFYREKMKSVKTDIYSILKENKHDRNS